MAVTVNEVLEVLKEKADDDTYLWSSLTWEYNAKKASVQLQVFVDTVDLDDWEWVHNETGEIVPKVRLDFELALDDDSLEGCVSARVLVDTLLYRMSQYVEDDLSTDDGVHMATRRVKQDG